jgi:hypothetical protein
MKALLENIRINHIIIEEGQQEAIVDAQLTQNGISFHSRLIIDPTDLNQLFAKLSLKGVEVSLSENFNCYQTEKGNLYTLDMEDFGWDNILIEEFIPRKDIRQIRA